MQLELCSRWYRRERTVGLDPMICCCLLGVLQGPRDGVGGVCGVVGRTEVLSVTRPVAERLFGRASDWG